MSNKDRFKACRYIDDGVYAGFDGAQIWIWTSNGVEESAPIALSTSPTFEKLVTLFGGREKGRRARGRANYGDAGAINRRHLALFRGLCNFKAGAYPRLFCWSRT